MKSLLPESRDEFLNSGALDKYERESTVLWTSLTHLHTNLHMLRLLDEYPTQFFQVPRAFVQLLAVNLFQYSIVLVCRLTERGGRRVTLDQFKGPHGGLGSAPASEGLAGPREGCGAAAGS